MQHRTRIALGSALVLAACTAQLSDVQPEPLVEVGTGSLQGSSSVGIGVGAGSYRTEGENVAYATIDGVQIRGYLARPITADQRSSGTGSGMYPALVLIHEWWGLNQNIRDLADQFAAQGYVALAVDMYEGESATDQATARELSGRVQQNMDRAQDNLRQAVTYLRTQPDVRDDALASVGWCFGGGWSYQMARNDFGLDASVMYYGRFSPHDDHSHMKTDIIGHFGEGDMSIKVDDVRTFQATLQTTNGDHEIYIYPNAGHAFANEDNAEAYNPEAAALAWQRTIAFLSEHVR